MFILNLSRPTRGREVRLPAWTARASPEVSGRRSRRLRPILNVRLSAPDVHHFANVTSTRKMIGSPKLAEIRTEFEGQRLNYAPFPQSAPRFRVMIFFWQNDVCRIMSCNRTFDVELSCESEYVLVRDLPVLFPSHLEVWLHA